MNITGDACLDDLFDRAAQPGPRILEQQGTLLRVIGEQHERVRDGVAGGLVAGHHQQDEERGELGTGQLLAVDVRRGQRRDQVVFRFLEPRGA